MRLILLRHGMTDHNLQRRYAGSLDIPLNGEGLVQAQKLALRMASVPVNAVYASDLKRARQTAQVVFAGRDIRILPSLREINFGIFEGLTFEEVDQKYPQLCRAWFDNPLGTPIPQGESFSDFCQRVRGGVASVLSGHKQESVVMVSHGGPLRVILSDAMGRKVEDMWSIEQHNSGVSIIEYDGARAPRVVLLNDTTHL